MINTLALLGASAICALGGLSYGAPKRASSVVSTYGYQDTCVLARTSFNMCKSNVNYDTSKPYTSCSIFAANPSDFDTSSSLGIGSYSLKDVLSVGVCTGVNSSGVSFYDAALMVTPHNQFTVGSVSYTFKSCTIKTAATGSTLWTWGWRDCPIGDNVFSSTYLTSRIPSVLNAYTPIYTDTSISVPMGKSYVAISTGTGSSPSELVTNTLSAYGYGAYKMSIVLDYDAYDLSSYEVIDIWSLMAAVLTMPFTFMASFWSTPLFVGTPFEFVPDVLIYSFFAISLLYGIVKLVISIIK